jgi:hypothetical protein
LHLLRRHDSIPEAPLHRIANELDPEELRKRPRALLWAPFWVALWFTAWFAYFRFFSTWKGWDPVLIMFATLYFTFPFAAVYVGYRKAKRARRESIRQVMLKHLRCPHCGYDIRGLRTVPEDGATICPECGCAWRL